MAKNAILLRNSNIYESSKKGGLPASMPFVLNSINKKVHLKNEVTFCVNSRIDAQKSAPRVQV